LENDNRCAALLLAPEAPYPLAGGGSLRTASLLEYLGRHYALDLIVFRQPGAPEPASLLPTGLVRRVTAIDLPATRRGPAARAIRNGLRLARGVPPLVDRFAGFGGQLERAVAGRRYEIGVVEHSWCAPYLEPIAAACRRTVLNLHNVESMLHARCAQAEGAAVGLAHRIFAEASARFEAEWLPRFGEVLAPSREDARAVELLAPGARVMVYPNAIPWVSVPIETKEQAIVFSGNLEYHPNISAVRFFAREVWPVLRERWPHLVWRLVGRAPDAVAKLVAGDACIQLSGPVNDAIAELGRAQVAVVPLLAGSGTRFKILEAWAAALPVVSTSIGAEGLPVRDGEHLLLADTAPAFADAVSRLLTCSDLRVSVGNSGRLLMEKEFTWETAWAGLDF
jgi:glycosyltransferase involved in cell wall biosynthesis